MIMCVYAVACILPIYCNIFIYEPLCGWNCSYQHLQLTHCYYENILYSRSKRVLHLASQVDLRRVPLVVIEIRRRAWRVAGSHGSSHPCRLRMLGHRALELGA